jgi:UDP-glucose 4-epimerase
MENMLEGKTVLITGGAGAIGCNLVSALLDKAEKIVVVDNLDSGHEEFVPKHARVQFIRGSILDERLMKGVFRENIDAVFHLAAHFANQNSIDHPEEDLEVNGMGTLKMLRLAQQHGVRRFVFASSSCVYGNVEGAVREDAPHALDTPYAITKLLGEHYAEFYHEYYKLPTVTLRIFNSFGPGEKPGKYRNVVPNFIAAAMKGQKLPITGTGNETRDFNWIGNTVHGLLLAAEKENAVGEVFNIASGKATPIKDIAERINGIAGNDAGIQLVQRRDWDRIMQRRGDISKAKKLLGYEPEIDLDKHLKMTYDWLKEVGI